MSPDAPPAPFDDAVVAAVAADHGVDQDDLAALVAAHQDLMARLPGVDNLVYEWRKQFDATVLHSDEKVYFVAAPEWAWSEFADSLDADEGETAALAAVHERIVAAHEAVDAEMADATPIVLVRE